MGGKLKIVKMDIDEAPETPTAFGIRSIPTMMAFSGVFWKVRVLLSLPWRMIFWVEGSFIWKPGAGSTSVTVYSPG